MAEYISKAKTTLIKASSRESIKLGDNYFTVEFTEERSVPEDCNLEEERALLWDDVNEEIDQQIDDIIDMYKSKK